MADLFEKFDNEQDEDEDQKQVHLRLPCRTNPCSALMLLKLQSQTWQQVGLAYAATDLSV